MPVKTSPVGEMDQPISILRVTESRDAAGGVAAQTSPFPLSRLLYAKERRRAGQESSQADLPVGITTAMLETKFFDGLLKTMRVRWQGEDWEIRDIHTYPRLDRIFIFVYRRGESGDGGGR